MPQLDGPIMATFAPRRAPTDSAAKTSVQEATASSPLFGRTSVIRLAQRPPRVHCHPVALRNFVIRSTCWAGSALWGAPCAAHAPAR